MPITVGASQTVTQHLAPGEVLTITAGAGCTGFVNRYEGPTLLDQTAITASSAPTWGPYQRAMQFAVSCTANALAVGVTTNTWPLEWLTSAQAAAAPQFCAALRESNTGAQNTAAIAAAVAAMILVSPGGGTIVLPQGDFDLAGTVDLDSAFVVPTLGDAGVTIRGQGIGGTVLTQQTAGVTTFRKSTQLAVNFEEFSLFGSDTANSNSVAIEFTAAAGMSLWRNVWIQGFHSGGRFIDITRVTFENVNWHANAYNVELGFNCDIFNFIGCKLDYATTTSILIGYRDAGHAAGALQCNNINFIGCRISNNAVAFDIADYGASNIQFLSSYFENNVLTGYYGDAAQSVGPKQVQFAGCFWTIVNASTPQIASRHANQESTLVVRSCRSDTSGFAGVWLSMGVNSRLIWEDNDLIAAGSHVTWNGFSYLLDKRQSFVLDNGTTLLADGSVHGSLVPLDVRMTNGTGKTWQTWTRRNAATGAALGESDSKVIDINGKYVCLQGPILFATPTSALPTAASTYRGIAVYQQGGAGVADTIKCCMKNAADAYTWTTIATGT